jgi:hypothetical protein
MYDLEIHQGNRCRIWVLGNKIYSIVLSGSRRGSGEAPHAALAECGVWSTKK